MAPTGFRFLFNSDTMRASDVPNETGVDTPEFRMNHPRCMVCEGLLRPAVIMFQDAEAEDCRPHHHTMQEVL